MKRNVSKRDSGKKDDKQKEIAGKKGRDWDAFPVERLTTVCSEPCFVL